MRCKAAQQASDGWPKVVPKVLVLDVAAGWQQREESPAWEWVEAE